MEPVWHYWKSPPLSGPLNMAWDVVGLQHAAKLETPILRFYSWSGPTTTFGYFQRYDAIAKQTDDSALVRRPTGGGLVPHRKDWTYSLAIPPNAAWYQLRATESYCQLHRWIQDSMTNLGINTQLNPEKDPTGPGSCFIGAEQNDLIHQGTKFAGAAQRRTRDGLLVQGSIQPPPAKFSRDQWEASLRTEATRQWGIQWERWTPESEQQHAAEKLAQDTFGRSAFIRRR